jgi:hypothetical protein
MMYVPSPVDRLRMLDAILKNRNYTATEKNVAAYLLARQNSKHGQCDPAYGTIARDLGIEKRSAMRAVKAIEAAGDLAIESRQNGAGGDTSNQFNFAFDKIGTVPAPDAGSDSGSNKPSCPDDPGVTPPSVHGVILPVTAAPLPPVTALSPKQGKRNKERGTQESLFVDSRMPLFDFKTWWEREFWPHCPLKVDEIAAKKLCRATIEGRRSDGLKATPDELVNGVLRFAAAMTGREDRYIMSPTKWLKNGRWTDRYGERTGPGAGRLSASEEAVWRAGEEMAARSKRAAG